MVRIGIEVGSLRCRFATGASCVILAPGGFLIGNVWTRVRSRVRLGVGHVVPGCSHAVLLVAAQWKYGLPSFGWEWP